LELADSATSTVPSASYLDFRAPNAAEKSLDGFDTSFVSVANEFMVIVDVIFKVDERA